MRRRVVFAVLVSLAVAGMPLGADGSSTAKAGPRFDPGSHAAIARQAREILAADGRQAIVEILDSPAFQYFRPPSTHLEAIVHGVVAADNGSVLPFYVPTPERHAHQPKTHRGWRIETVPCGEQFRWTFPSAADEAQTFFNRARNDRRSGREYDAMVWLGIALHFVQDQSVPHHAKASPESATAKYGVCGNGTHDLYEDWVRDNHGALPHADSDGLYDLGDFDHSNPATPYAWVDHAAHEGLLFYRQVNERSEVTCAPVPEQTGNCYRVASGLVPSAERRSAGFIAFFFR